MHASNRKIQTQARKPIEEKNYEKEVVEKEVKEEEHFIVTYLRIAQRVHDEGLREEKVETPAEVDITFLKRYSGGELIRPFADRGHDEIQESRKSVLEIMETENENAYKEFIHAQTQAQDLVEKFLDKIKYPIKDKAIYKKLKELFLSVTPKFKEILSKHLPDLNKDDLERISSALTRAYIFTMIAPRFALSKHSHLLEQMRNELECDNEIKAIKEKMRLRILTPSFIRQYRNDPKANEIYLKLLKKKLDDISQSDFNALIIALKKMRDEKEKAKGYVKKENKFLKDICKLIADQCVLNENKKHHGDEETNQECNLYVMESNELPENLDDYKNSFILFNCKDLTQLNYVKANGKVQLVNGNTKTFLSNLSGLVDKSNPATLSDEQVSELITSNGGFTHKEWKINESDLGEAFKEFPKIQKLIKQAKKGQLRAEKAEAKSKAKSKAKEDKKAKKEKRKGKEKGDKGIDHHPRTASACQSLDSIHRISVRKQSGLEKSQHRLSSKNAHLNSGVKGDDIEKQKDAAPKKLQRTQGFRRGKKALEQKQPSLSQRCTTGEKNEDKQPKFTPFLLQQPDVIKRGISPESQIGEGASLGAGNPSSFWNKSHARQQLRTDRSSSSSMPSIPSPSRNGGDS